MDVVVSPGKMNGTVCAPTSKSYSQRTMAGALLHSGTTNLLNVGQSNDEMACLKIIESLGAKISYHNNVVSITGTGNLTNANNAIFCGESGLATRLFAPIVALLNQSVMLDGAGSLLKRDLSEIKEILTLFGVTVIDSAGHMPLTIMGPIQPVPIELSLTESSQLLSGLLFALSHIAQSPLTLTIHNLTSKPYIDLTIDVLRLFGRRITHQDHKFFTIWPKYDEPNGDQELTIANEGDWSGAANMLVAGAIAGTATVSNLSINSVQADRAILKVLEAVGADVVWNDDTITVSQGPLQSFRFDATDCPDLFPVLSVLAAFCNGESRITGLHRLANKESDRAATIMAMLTQFGIPFSIQNNTLVINGIDVTQACIVNSYNDHRIAMAAAVAALRANAAVTITTAEAVNKSYPLFFNDLTSFGITILEVQPS